jgi:hypothetical protein
MASAIIDEKCRPPQPQRNCGFHPLIHTLLEFYLAQDLVGSVKEKTHLPEQHMEVPNLQSSLCFMRCGLHAAFFALIFSS